MHRNYFFVIVCASVLSVLIVIVSMSYTPSSPVIEQQLAPPPSSPYSSNIAALGIVEASSGNINIGSSINRVVDKVFVRVGQKVKKGEPLLQFEDNDLKANLIASKYAYENAALQAEKLRLLPRPEDLIAVESVYKEAAARAELAKSSFDRVQGLDATKAMSQEQIDKRYYDYIEAAAAAEKAQADVEKTKAGAWKPDLDIAEAEALQAKAQVQGIEADISKTLIRSPIEGTVLQINVHEGEIPSMDSSREPIMIVGNTDVMHMRVNINQYEISSFSPAAPAVAFSQGDSRIKVPLKFVRVEPFLVTKQNLTNDVMDKVDTRVLQVIYQFKTEDKLIFVGQQMDVFIEKKQQNQESSTQEKHA